MKSITNYTSLAYIWQGKNSILFCGGLYNASPAAHPSLPRQRRRTSCRLVNAMVR